jgi:glycosidase
MKIKAAYLVSILSLLVLNVTAQTRWVNPAGASFKGAPEPADAVIYEIDVRYFSRDGNLKGVIKGLDSVKALGANVIYLMPIYPVGEVKSFGSPYCIRDYTSVNKNMGTMDDLRMLVTAAHQRNIAVILDWVANHTSFDHPWIANRDWYLRDGAGNALSPPGKGWDDVAQLNFNNSEMRTAIIKAMQYWIINAGVDGFRCDYADGPPIGFWKKAIASTRNVSKRNLLFLAESGTPQLYEAGFDVLSGFDFYNNLKQVYKDNKSARSIEGISTLERNYTSTRHSVAGYITNHDLIGSDGPVAKVFGNDRGAIAAFVTAISTQGTPIIYSGQEKMSVNGISQQINAEYKKLLALRDKSDTMKRGHITSYSSDDMYVIRKDYRSESILVICNLRNKRSFTSLPSSLRRKKWRDMLTEQKKELNTNIELESYDYFILKAIR